MPNLVFGEWNKSLVCGPGILDDVFDMFEGLIQPRSAQRPDSCTVSGFVQNGLHELGRGEMGGETIGQQVLHALISLGSQPSGIVRPGVAHHNHWRRVVTVNKKPALLVIGAIERYADST